MANIKVVSIIYSLFLVFSGFIIANTETRVLELNNSCKKLKYTKKRLLSAEYDTNVVLAYQHIISVDLHQKITQKAYCLKVRYHLQLKIDESLKIQQSIKLFKTSGLHHAKKHYYILNYLLNKEFTPYDANIPIHTKTKTEKGTESKIYN